MVSHVTGLTPLSELSEQLFAFQRGASFFQKKIFLNFGQLQKSRITQKKEDIEIEN